MNTNELDKHIEKAWAQVVEAAKNKDLAATQHSVRELAQRQELKEQALAIEKRIASLSNGESAHTGLQADVSPKLSVEHIPYVSRRKRPTVRPSEIRIGTYRKAINYANQIPIAVANWLIEQKKSLPRIPNFIQPNNSGFARSAQTKELLDGSFIEVGDHQEVLIQKARKLLDACGYRGIKIEIIFDDETLRTA